MLEDRKEAMELTGYKLSLVLVEKMIIQVKSNKLSEGKLMG
jgi:hypothetical protein